VVAYWIRVGAAPDVDDDTRGLAHDRAARGLVQIGLGLHQLRRHARLTPFGRELLDEIEARRVALWDELRAAGLPEDPPVVICTEEGAVTPLLSADGARPVRVKEHLAEHVRLFAPADQADDLLPLLS
jgi:hypothetical protein